MTPFCCFKIRDIKEYRSLTKNICPSEAETYKSKHDFKTKQNIWMVEAFGWWSRICVRRQALGPTILKKRGDNHESAWSYSVRSNNIIYDVCNRKVLIYGRLEIVYCILFSHYNKFPSKSKMIIVHFPLLSYVMTHSGFLHLVLMKCSSMPPMKLFKPNWSGSDFQHCFYKMETCSWNKLRRYELK